MMQVLNIYKSHVISIKKKLTFVFNFPLLFPFIVGKKESIFDCDILLTT